MKTKKLILLIATILVAVGCGKTEYRNKFKYKNGDEVYFKIDKQRGIIQSQLNVDSIPAYNVLYLTEFGEYKIIDVYEYNLTDNNL